MICPPEFVIHKPHPQNDFKWVVEIVDPPSQGVYKTFTLCSGVSLETLRINIEYAMLKIYEDLGLSY